MAGHSDRSGHGLTGATGSTSAGPHSSSLANKGDPRVDSDLDGSKTAGNAGYGFGTGPVAGAGSQGVLGRDTQSDSGRDTGILPTNQTPSIGYGQDFAGDPCQQHAIDGSPLFTKGPHVTDTANLLDPHVTPSITIPSASTAPSSDREPGSITQGGNAYGHGVPEIGSTTHGADRHDREISDLGSTTHGSDRHGREVPEVGLTTHDRRETTGSEPIRHGDDHYGRDAALGGGLGAASAAAYSSGHDDTPSAEQTSSTTGPHRSKLLNKLDPRVHSGSASSEGPTTSAETSAPITSSKTGSSSHVPTSEKVAGSHDYARDAGIAGAVGTIGAIGGAGYEAQNHPRDHDTTPATTSAGAVGSSDTPGTNTRENYGQDVRSAPTGGIGSSETEIDAHNEKSRGLTSHLPKFLGGHHDKSREPTDLGHDDTASPTTTKDLTGTGPERGSDHRFIRDAGLASAGIGGGLAAYETQKIHDRDDPVTTTEPSTYPPADYGDGGRVADTYAGRDPTSVGAVGAGSGTADEAEFSKREAEKLADAREKEFRKEQEAIHKEQVKHEKALEKEEKKHEKEEKKHEKEEKKHEKEEKKHEKEEKKHENEEKKLLKEEKKHEKEEKKHEKELAKEEKKQHHEDGKKHGGILGLFRRDKTDSQDESDVRDPDPAESYQGTAAATGIGAGVEDEKPKHEPHKLHKDPPAGYYESKGYPDPK